MSRTILLRHGQSLYNAGETDDFDSDVTERGNYQIQDAALHVKEVMGWGPTGYWIGFVSPYIRCLKTALPINKLLGVGMTVDARIAEVPDDLQAWKCGNLPNRQANFPTYDWKQFPDGMNVTERTMEEYRDDLKLFAKVLPDFAVVVSHMTTIRNLAEVITGLNLKGKDITNCSLTLIEDDELVFVGRR